MKRLLILFTVYCVCFTFHISPFTSALAQPPLTPPRSMQCDFVQTKHIRMLNDQMVSRGRMYYQQPDKLRWEYTSPYAYVFVLNNDKVLVERVERREERGERREAAQKRRDVIDVNRNKLFREIARVMMNSVVGNCLQDDRNFKSSVSAVGGEWVATLLPLRKDMKQMFQCIVLHFSQKQGVVTQVELTEKNGDKTVIELKNIRTNEAVDAKLFAVP